MKKLTKDFQYLYWCATGNSLHKLGSTTLKYVNHSTMLTRSNIQNHMFACCLFPFEWMHTSDYSVLQNKPQFNRPWTESIRLRILSIWIMNYRSQRPTENISIYKSRLFVLIAWSIKRMSLLRQCQSIRIFHTIIHVVDQMSNT